MLSAYDQLLRMEPGQSIQIEALYGLRYIVRYVSPNTKAHYEVQTPWGVKVEYPIEKGELPIEFARRRIAATLLIHMGAMLVREAGDIPLELHTGNIARVGKRYAAWHLASKEIAVYGDTVEGVLEGYMDWLEAERTLTRKDGGHAKKSNRKRTGTNAGLRPEKAKQPKRRSHRKPSGRRRAAAGSVDAGIAVSGEGETQRKPKQRRAHRPAQHPGTDQTGAAGRPEQADAVRPAESGLE